MEYEVDSTLALSHLAQAADVSMKSSSAVVGTNSRNLGLANSLVSSV